MPNKIHGGGAGEIEVLFSARVPKAGALATNRRRIRFAEGTAQQGGTRGILCSSLTGHGWNYPLRITRRSDYPVLGFRLSKKSCRGCCARHEAVTIFPCKIALNGGSSS